MGMLHAQSDSDDRLTADPHGRLAVEPPKYSHFYIKKAVEDLYSGQTLSHGRDTHRLLDANLLSQQEWLLR